MYSNIIDPKTGQKLSIFSTSGKKLIKQYIREYKKGGAETPPPPVEQFIQAVKYTNFEEARRIFNEHADPKSFFYWSCPFNGDNALHLLFKDIGEGTHESQKKKLDFLYYLLDKGAKYILNIPNLEGRTAVQEGEKLSKELEREIETRPDIFIDDGDEECQHKVIETIKKMIEIINNFLSERRRRESRESEQ